MRKMCSLDPPISERGGGGGDVARNWLRAIA